LKKIIALFLLLTNSVICQKSNKIIELEKQIKNEKDEKKIGEIYSKLGYEYSDIDAKLTKKYLAIALNIAKKHKLSHLECLTYNNYGICYRFANNPDSAKYFFDKAVKLGEDKKDNKFLVTGYVSLGWYYNRKNEYPMALKYYTMGLEKAQLTKNKKSEADAYRKIADIHLNLNENSKAFEKFRKATNIYYFLKDTNSYGEVLGSTGYAYRRVGKIDSAIKYFYKCITVFKSINNFALVPTAYTEIGKAYYENKEFKKAETNFLLAIDEHKKSSNYAHDDGLYIYLGQTQIQLKKYNEAKKNIDKGYKYAIESQDLEMQIEATSGLSNYYEKIGDFKNALLLKNKNIILVDSIEAKSNLLQTNEMLKKYDFEKQQRIIEKASFDQKQKNYLIGSIIAFFCLLSLLGFTNFKRYKANQKIALQKAVFNQQTLATQAVLDGEERERKRIAADLHDGVGQTIMALKMNLLGINDHIEFKSDKAKQIFEKAVDLASETAKEVRTISHQMMPNALIKSGLASAIREFISNLDSQNLKINLEVNNLNTPLEPTVEKVLYRVIQEAVNNVIKHAKASELNININKTENEILTTIKDNGRGFDTQNADYEGIGLKNIKDRIAFLKGSILISSEIGKGTQTSIKIPIS
jgi:two-component system, NarL family, sensor kinase